MRKKNRRTIGVSLVLLIILIISSLVSYSKFSVFNPFSAAYGLIQVIFMEKEYVVIQKSPKVIVAKPNASLKDYMKNLGFEEDKENRFGSLHRFYNGDEVQDIMYSTNAYFSKWIWQE